MNNGINFFDLAENSYAYFIQSYNNNMVFNDMTVNAANTIEKYLKHIAMLSEDTTVEEMPEWAKDHNIGNVLKHLKDSGDLNINRETERAILRPRMYLYCARYPEYDNSHIVTQEDIDLCKRGLVVCRNLTLDYIKEYEAKKEVYVDDIEREF